MNIKNITDKLKDTMVAKDIKKENYDLTELEEKEITEDTNMKEQDKEIAKENLEEDNPISDETEIIEEQPLRIKTIIVKEEEQQAEVKKKKLSDAAKIVAGVGIAAAGLAVLLFNSKKRK